MVNSTLPDEEFVLTLMQIDEAKSVAEEVAGEANLSASVPICA